MTAEEIIAEYAKLVSRACDMVCAPPYRDPIDDAPDEDTARLHIKKYGVAELVWSYDDHYDVGMVTARREIAAYWLTAPDEELKAWQQAEIARLEREELERKEAYKREAEAKERALAVALKEKWGL